MLAARVFDAVLVVFLVAMVTGTGGLDPVPFMQDALFGGREVR